MKILITGAAGFIGSHLADRLLADGHEVVGIDDLSTGKAANVPAGMELVIGDVAALSGLGDFEVIYHCAASYRDRDAWERDTRTNVLGTIAVVREAQRSGARLIYLQTSLCYGLHPASPVQTDAPLNPHGSYAITKTAGESFIRDSGVDWVSLRLANVYGPRNLSGAVPTFYQRLAAGKPCTVVDTRRDQVYIDDLVRLAVTVMTKGRGIYHAATGADISILDLYQVIARAMGHDGGEPEVIPRGADDAPSILLDPTETYQELGWTARTPLVTGIRKAVDWYRVYGVTETYSHLAQR